MLPIFAVMVWAMLFIALTAENCNSKKATKIGRKRSAEARRFCKVIRGIAELSSPSPSPPT